MKKRKRYQNQKDKDKGSSLLFVIVAMAFVAILGTLLSQLTVINMQMKSTDKKSKETFYTNETALNELQIALEDMSGDAMKKAYVGIVGNYANITNSATQNLQSQFTYEYLKELAILLTNGGNIIGDVSSSADYAGMVKTGSSSYLPSAIKTKMNAIFAASAEKTKVSPSTWFLNEDSGSSINNTLEYSIDNSTGGGESYIILRNITVSYNTKEDKAKNDPDTLAHQSTITTDIKLTVPPLDFQSGIYPKYTTYALIANKNLVTSASNVSVDGDLYGSSGILVEGGNTSFTGPKTTNIITRGDFLVNQGASVKIEGKSSSTSVASDCVRIWANNFGTSKGTTGGTSATNIDFTGDAFIQDDLVLNANGSSVNMKGNNYYGFGYNRMNKSFSMMSAREKREYMNSQFSSSITINGKDISLNMSGMNNVMLAGRAYISRGQETSSMQADTEMGSEYHKSTDDIMTGETVAFKSNQTAYLLPGSAIAGGVNPMPAPTYVNLLRSGKELVDTGKIRTVRKYLASTPYTTYCYNIQNSGSYVYFYYNFRSQAAANEYFSTYYASNKSALEKKLKSSGYINNSGDGVKISPNINILAAACTGNVLQATKDGDMELKAAGNNPDGDLTSILTDAVKKAKEYYSMQLELSTESTKYPISGDETDGVDFRIKPNGTNEQKSEYHPIYSEILQGEAQFVAEATSATPSNYGFQSLGHDGIQVKRVDASSVAANAAVYFIYVPDGVTNPVVITSDFLKKFTGSAGSIDNKGIIVASGEIKMDADFTGMVLSKSNILIETNNRTLQADTQLVQQILTYGQQSITDPKQKFAHYFGLASAGKSVSPTSVDISSYISYSNWKKAN